MPKNDNFFEKNNPYTALLFLENGDIFWGEGVGSEKIEIAELCFNTSITGYQEILTDPSYAKQIINFTFPHIGIVGTNENDNESVKCFASGCVFSSNVNEPSNWRAKNSISKWLKKNNLPGITNIDTRYITRLLSEKGAIKSALFNFGKKKVNLEQIKEKIDSWNGLNDLDLSKVVSTKKVYTFNESKWNNEKNSYIIQNGSEKFSKVVCIDYGVKKNILRSLASRDLQVIVVPANSSFEEIIKHDPKGIFLSNGPGDPSATGKFAIPVIKKLIDSGIPIFGICLGHQILSLSLGGKTKKMFQGHRGGNHPVKNLKTGKVEITCQNHGFEVLRNFVSNQIIETHISLFDNTNEGLRHTTLPIFSVQYHPEASPGPHDSNYLFDEFKENIERYAEKN